MQKIEHRRENFRFIFRSGDDVQIIRAADRLAEKAESREPHSENFFRLAAQQQQPDQTIFPVCFDENRRAIRPEPFVPR